MIGAESPETLSGWRYSAFDFIVRFFAKFEMILFGFIWLNVQYVNEDTKDYPKTIELYRKFLGPGWHSKHTGAGM